MDLVGPTVENDAKLVKSGTEINYGSLATTMAIQVGLQSPLSLPVLFPILCTRGRGRGGRR